MGRKKKKKETIEDGKIYVNRTIRVERDKWNRFISAINPSEVVGRARKESASKEIRKWIDEVLPSNSALTDIKNNEIEEIEEDEIDKEKIEDERT